MKRDTKYDRENSIGFCANRIVYKKLMSREMHGLWKMWIRMRSLAIRGIDVAHISALSAWTEDMCRKNDGNLRIERAKSCGWRWCGARNSTQRIDRIQIIPKSMGISFDLYESTLEPYQFRGSFRDFPRYISIRKSRTYCHANSFTMWYLAVGPVPDVLVSDRIGLWNTK